MLEREATRWWRRDGQTGSGRGSWYFTVFLRSYLLAPPCPIINPFPRPNGPWHWGILLSPPHYRGTRASLLQALPAVSLYLPLFLLLPPSSTCRMDPGPALPRFPSCTVLSLSKPAVKQGKAPTRGAQCLILAN